MSSLKAFDSIHHEDGGYSIAEDNGNFNRFLFRLGILVVKFMLVCLVFLIIIAEPLLILAFLLLGVAINEYRKMKKDKLNTPSR